MGLVDVGSSSADWVKLVERMLVQRAAVFFCSTCGLPLNVLQRLRLAAKRFIILSVVLIPGVLPRAVK